MVHLHSQSRGGSTDCLTPLTPSPPTRGDQATSLSAAMSGLTVSEWQALGVTNLACIPERSSPHYITFLEEAIKKMRPSPSWSPDPSHHQAPPAWTPDPSHHHTLPNPANCQVVVLPTSPPQTPPKQAQTAPNHKKLSPDTSLQKPAPKPAPWQPPPNGPHWSPSPDTLATLDVTPAQTEPTDNAASSHDIHSQDVSSSLSPALLATSPPSINNTTSSPMMASVQYWDVKDVENWLKNNGFSPYVEQLCKKHALNGCSLLMLQEDNFKSNEMKSLGDHKRLLMGIHELCAQNPEAQNQYLKSQPEGVGELALVAEEDNKCSIFVGEVEEKSLEGKQLKPEYVKVFVSYLYMSMASLAASMVVAIAHDRTPDRKQHPPLPDLILDNLPLIPIAFELSEMVALTLACISLLVIFFHKHRFILLRRLFTISGTTFILRCITMLITSLSIPGIHMKCQPKTAGDFWSRFSLGIQVWSGFGLSLQGIRTCGDYMFSGHTVLLTLLNFFITEYTPRTFYRLHILTWLLTLAGMFFILAGHVHYSIDVFIAFDTTSRLFLYYHSLLHNHVLYHNDRKKTRMWFPFFTYFESNCNRIVPNEFEWPLPWPNSLKVFFEKTNERHRKKCI